MNKRRPPSSAQTPSPSKKQASILDWIKGTGGGNGDRDENEPGTPTNRGDAIIGDQRQDDCPICAASLTKLAAEVRGV